MQGQLNRRKNPYVGSLKKHASGDRMQRGQIFKQMRAQGIFDTSGMGPPKRRQFARIFLSSISDHETLRHAVTSFACRIDPIPTR
jgi:hypothetical protein